MSLVPGTRLGPFEILAPIGAGGMGEVYRAKDTTLGRDVAIKVLPQAVASESDRVARFQREAQALAALNHPNIASIYGFEQSGQVRALVMELVEGPTLAERIAADPMSPEQAPEIARQKGIVHRDLKPANVKVTPDGQVKVLDFGLAKAMAGEAPSGDPFVSPTMMSTLTMDSTRAGIILGTAAYVSPEQARGKIVDKRADIWAFGGLIRLECDRTEAAALA